MFKLNRNYILLHIIVFIWGFTGILGALISISADRLVWYRTLIASFTLGGYLLYKKASFKKTPKEILQFLGTGLVICIHWLAFYHSIKVSNVSVCLAVFSSASFFMAFLEPIFYKRKLVWYEMALGVVVMLAIFMIFKVDQSYKEGIIYSLLAALTSALFSLINGKLTHQHDALIISFYELFGGFLFLTIFFLVMGHLNPSYLHVEANDLGWLFILAIVCTVFPFVTSVSIMKEISPYTVVLTVNLEPVYAILLAYLFLDEGKTISPQFYLGAAIILLTVFANAYLKSREK